MTSLIQRGVCAAAVLIAGMGTASAQGVVVYPAPVVSYYAPAPVVSYYAPAPVPAVSYYAPAPAPTVSYYAPAPAPVVSYYAPAPAPVPVLNRTTYYGLFGRPRAVSYSYGFLP